MRGIAIPHGKIEKVDHLTAVMGISREGIDYDSLDGEAVHVVFLLVASQRSAGEHIKALQKIVHLLKSPSFYSRVLNAKNSQEVHLIIREEEIDEEIGEE